MHYKSGSAVRRPAFVGDPAYICPHVQPEKSARYHRPEYEANKAKRAQQGAPAAKSKGGK